MIFVSPLGMPLCYAFVAWRCGRAPPVQLTLVLPQRGIAIVGVCVWVCGDGSGFRLYAYLPPPGAPPGAHRTHSPHRFRSTLGAGDAGGVFWLQKQVAGGSKKVPKT